MLAWTIYLSFIGAGLILWIDGANTRGVRTVALLSALAGFAVALVGAAQGVPPGGLTAVSDLAWIPSLGIRYHLAADGISLTLVLLTGIASVVGILFSWNIEHRAKEFFIFYLTLIGGVYGVFLSFDLFLLFVFYELAIIPKPVRQRTAKRRLRAHMVDCL